MDRYLKRPLPTSTDSSPSRCALSPAPKKPKISDKQGNVAVSFRAKEFGPNFYESGGKLFCRPCNVVIEHHRKSTVTKHINSKLCYIENLLVLLYLIFSELLLLKGRLRYTYCKTSNSEPRKPWSSKFAASPYSRQFREPTREKRTIYV